MQLVKLALYPFSSGTGPSICRALLLSDIHASSMRIRTSEKKLVSVMPHFPFSKMEEFITGRRNYLQWNKYTKIACSSSLGLEVASNLARRFNMTKAASVLHKLTLASMPITFASSRSELKAASDLTKIYRAGVME